MIVNVTRAEIGHPIKRAWTQVGRIHSYLVGIDPDGTEVRRLGLLIVDLENCARAVDAVVTDNCYRRESRAVGQRLRTFERYRDTFSRVRYPFLAKETARLKATVDLPQPPFALASV